MTDPLPSPRLYRTDYHRQDNDLDPWHYVDGCGCECCRAWEDWVLGLDQEQGDQVQEAHWWAYHHHHHTEGESDAG